MMWRAFLFLMILSLSAGFCQAQNSRKVKALQRQKTELQKTLKKSQDELNRTRKQVQSGEKTICYLDVQLDKRLEHIHGLETELDGWSANSCACSAISRR